MRKTIEEFKQFAVKGNVVDLAIAVIIGGAFGKIVTSLVNDIVMPPIGALVGGVKFSALVITLKKATADAAAVTLNYGAFIQTIIDFLIIAWVIFIAIKLINSLKAKEEEKKEEEPKPSAEEVLLGEIRDLLKEKK